MSATLISLLALIQLLLLVTCSLVIVVTLYRHWTTVLYRRGVVALVATLLVFAVGAVVDVAAERGLNVVLFEMVDDVLFTAASALAVVATWSFARDFVVTERDEPVELSAKPDETTGGFEDA